MCDGIHCYTVMEELMGRVARSTLPDTTRCRLLSPSVASHEPPAGVIERERASVASSNPLMHEASRLLVLHIYHSPYSLRTWSTERSTKSPGLCETSASIDNPMGTRMLSPSPSPTLRVVLDLAVDNLKENVLKKWQRYWYMNKALRLRLVHGPRTTLRSVILLD